jgi:hypothetical protein
MAKKNKMLNKQERKYYSTLIARKLEENGVKDQITTKKLGTKKFVDPYRLGSDGKPLVLFEGDVIQLQNPHRNLLKQVRRFPKKLVLAFLAGFDKAKAKKETA